MGRGGLPSWRLLLGYNHSDNINILTWKKNYILNYFYKYVMCTTFSQQIISDKLL